MTHSKSSHLCKVKTVKVTNINSKELMFTKKDFRKNQIL